jgi:protein-L-isoaspartate(D-aspartate) O-methyltransferase
METLIDYLIKQGYLKTPEIIDAFRKINRADFLPEDEKYRADLNTPLPIGYGQTCSQPLTVAFMLEQLQPKRGDKVLDIGFGSGWLTALLAQIVGQSGKVYALEIISALEEFGERNIAKYNFIKKGIVQCFCADGSKGFLSRAPFNKIIVSASAEEIPSSLKKQLKVGGRLVIPILDSIYTVDKKSENDFEEQEFAGFVFVPLVEE